MNEEIINLLMEYSNTCVIQGNGACMQFGSLMESMLQPQILAFTCGNSPLINNPGWQEIMGLPRKHEIDVMNFLDIKAEPDTESIDKNGCRDEAL